MLATPTRAALTMANAGRILRRKAPKTVGQLAAFVVTLRNKCGLTPWPFAKGW
jgi:hypothetical protein